MSEAARVAAIEALRLPGTDASVDRAKADQTITPPMAASLILAEYKAALAAKLPTGRHSGGAVDVNIAALPDHARAAWKASPALQADHASADTYANYQDGVARGRIRIHGQHGPAARATRAEPISLALIADEARAAWRASPALQADHASADAYANWRQGVAQGRIRIHGQRLP